MTLVARRILGAAAVLGVAAEMLFAHAALGANVLIGTVALLGAAGLVRSPDRSLDRYDRWLPAGAVVAAVFVAIRADPLLALADLGLAVLLVGASLVALGGVPVTRSAARAAIELAARASVLLATGSAAAFRQAGLGVRGADAARRAGHRYGRVVRGVAFGLPLFVIFATLFASADAVFRRWIETMLSIRIDPGELPGRLLFAGACGWCAGGALWATAVELPLLRRGARSNGDEVNPVGPQAFVTARNLERAVNPSSVPRGGEIGLDTAYLAGLGDGAVPALVDALPRLRPVDRQALLPVLAEHRWRLAADPWFAGWPAWNLDRGRARSALDRLFGGQ